jgi:hypothetical protein
MNTVNLVVTCTKKKTREPGRDLMLRHLRGASTESRAAAWLERLERHTGERLAARDLYAGDHWSIARELDGSRLGRTSRVRVWVASAGYGLLSMDNPLQPYSATFAVNHPDSVVGKPFRRSPLSAQQELQKMGYTYIGVGGLVPLQSDDILAALSAIDKVRKPATALHLFGVNRCEHLDDFRDYGVVSFDSTSPLLQAFKHDRDNYYTESFKYSALRVPQVEGNAKFGSRIRAGEVNQDQARKLEQACLQGLMRFDRQGGSVPRLVKLLRDYDLVHDGRKDRSEDYGKTLEDQPWKTCPCRVCRDLGIHVVIFRGAERNRRRGFHNLYVTYHHFHQPT